MAYIQTMNFSPFPILQTQRLRLRKLTHDDKEAIYLLRSNDKVNEFIDRQKPDNVDQVMEFIANINSNIDKGESIYWAITLTGNANVIGAICLWNFSEEKNIAELGYELNPDFQGFGLMSEAISCVIKYAFEQLGLKAIEAFTNKNNLRSIRLLEKHGFTLLPTRFDEENPLNIVFTLKASI
jgi:ribosomal-protein-alanine N-acetyltransferase